MVLTHGQATFPGRTRNLSQGGLCCDIEGGLPLGADCGLRLSLVFDENTFSEPLELTGRVVWSTPLAGGSSQIGLTFTGMNQDLRHYLQMFRRFLEDSRNKDGADSTDEEPEKIDERSDKGGFFE